MTISGIITLSVQYFPLRRGIQGEVLILKQFAQTCHCEERCNPARADISVCLTTISWLILIFIPALFRQSSAMLLPASITHSVSTPPHVWKTACTINCSGKILLKKRFKYSTLEMTNYGGVLTNQEGRFAYLSILNH